MNTDTEVSAVHLAPQLHSGRRRNVLKGWLQRHRLLCGCENIGRVVLLVKWISLLNRCMKTNKVFIWKRQMLPVEWDERKTFRLLYCPFFFSILQWFDVKFVCFKLSNEQKKE